MNYKKNSMQKSKITIILIAILLVSLNILVFGRIDSNGGEEAFEDPPS